MKHLLIIIAVFALGCTKADKSREVLEASGFTDIEITGYSIFSCSDDDSFKTGFIATSPSGQRIEGAVCCGWVKNCTIRY